MFVLEVLVALVVLSLIVSITTPRIGCALSRARVSATIEELRQARDLIEAHEAETGVFPHSLETVYRGRRVPKSLMYCAEGVGENRAKGDGCHSLAAPSLGGSLGGPSAGFKYLLLTERSLSDCSNIDYLWLSCCGMEPRIVHYDEGSLAPGH
jgi:type II secretory pathway pseudopilin PulG